MSVNRAALVAVACAALVAGGAGVAVGGSGPFVGDDGVVRACYDATTGLLRVADADGACLPTEEPLSFNQTGPAGPEGPVGPQGEPGPAGAPARTASILVAGNASVRTGHPDLTVQHISTGYYLVQAPDSYADCVPTATAADFSADLPVAGRQGRYTTLRVASQPGAFFVESYLPAGPEMVDGGFTFTLSCPV